MRKGEADKRRAVARKLGIEELLTRPLKDRDPRRFPRSMPGMREWLVNPLAPIPNDLKYGELNRKLMGKTKSNPVRRA
jgi:hypothetical protein